MKEVSVIQADNITLGLTLIHLYFAKGIIDQYGIDGDSAVRKSLVKYATVRGEALRKVHMSLGMKTNLKNMFYYGSNPYSEASFVNHMGHVTEQEDVRETSYCPLADEIIKRGQQYLATTYCEEVHPPLWQSYAPTAIVNLGKTLSQVGGTKCTFDVFLRPGRMTAQQRKECFEEYDPDFKGDRRDEYKVPRSKPGNCAQAVIMICSYYTKCRELLDDGVVAVFEDALEQWREDYVACLKKSAQEQGVAFDWEFCDKNNIFEREVDQDPWDEYGNEEIKQFVKVNLYDKFATEVNNG